MRLSQFHSLVIEEFGDAYAGTLLRTHVVTGLGGCTAEEALARGEQPRTVWEALCVDFDVPSHRRLGRVPVARTPNPL